MFKFSKFSLILLVSIFLLISLLIFYSYNIRRRVNPPIQVLNIKTGILREVNVAPGKFGEGYKEIVPGLTTKQEVIAKLGSKLKRKMKDGYEHLIYIYDPKHDIEGDVIVSINEKGIVERLNHRADLKQNGADINYWLQKYSDPEVLTYSNYYYGVFEYIYPSRGVWFRTNGAVILTWFYFQPVSAKIFLETIGKEFPIENPYME